MTLSKNEVLEEQNEVDELQKYRGAKTDWGAHEVVKQHVKGVVNVQEPLEKILGTRL